MRGRAVGSKRKRSGGRRRAALLLVLAAAVLALAWLWRETPHSAPPVPAETERPEITSLPEVRESIDPPPHPLDARVSSIPREELPSLAESDTFIRTRARSLSSHAAWNAWLAKEGLVDLATVVVASIAEGLVPRRPLSFLAPARPFRVIREADEIRIHPRSYERFDAFAVVVESIDVARASELYRAWYPLFQDSYALLGASEPDFHAQLRAAVSELLRVPELAEEPRLVPRTKRYEFADPDLESLSDAQKQLLRMGPRNVGRIQTSLRRLAAEFEMDPAGDDRAQDSGRGTPDS